MITFMQCLPNIITLIALSCGVSSIRSSMLGLYDYAIWLMLTCMILDGVDGKLARRLNCSNPKGAILDSLADLVNFGIAPSVCIMTLYGDTVSFLTCVIFVNCMALRLAGFELIQKIFQGLPSPAAALCALVPILLRYEGYYLDPCYIFCYLTFISWLMLSTVKFIKVSELGNSRLIVSGIILLLMSYIISWRMIVVSISAIYLMSSIITRNYRQNVLEL